jgi:hypothetical protein
VSGGAARSPDLGDLGIGSTYVDGNGMVWVRGSATGSVPLQVTGNDPESGIARNNATVAGNGWHVDWAGSSTNGNLRLSYGSQSTTATLTVSSVNDKGSGMAAQQIIGRYRAPLNSNGTCRTNAFLPDGDFRLASDNSWDSGLQANSCYVWSIRTLDRVGNMSTSIVSGYVITEP